ncbi:Eco47II family restriction endonuclease [Candidatus Poribacteria bacterium]|nr:Eco47II family restriction endonuclease [Candidatus Poribacteria bacterium]
MPQRRLPSDRLSWISDADLESAISSLFSSAKNTIQKAEKRRERNVVDPFYSVLIASSFELKTIIELDNLQDAGAALRGISNFLGEFHQKILGSINGWNNHDSGYDLECPMKSIIAEVKNKHNTMNSTNTEAVISDLDTAIRQKKGNWKAYLVQVIPRSPYRSTNIVRSRGVYVIDGASFYHLATGEPNAIHDLFDVFCDMFSLTDEICQYCKLIMLGSLPPRI